MKERRKAYFSSISSSLATTALFDLSVHHYFNILNTTSMTNSINPQLALPDLHNKLINLLKNKYFYLWHLIISFTILSYLTLPPSDCQDKITFQNSKIWKNWILLHWKGLGWGFYILVGDWKVFILFIALHLGVRKV